MTTFEQKIVKHYNWTDELTTKIIYEYERFLAIKLSNPQATPSDLIDKLWKYHVLNLEIYCNYCNQKFGKLIYYELIDNCIGQELRIKNITDTFAIYIKMFGNPMYPEVWNFNLNLTPIQIQSIQSNQSNQLAQPNQFTLPLPIKNSNFHNFANISNPISQISKISPIVSDIPNYLANKPVIPNLKIYIKYTNKSKQGLYSNQLIDYPVQESDTVNKIKEIISINTQNDINLIKLYPHPNLVNINNYNMIDEELNPLLNIKQILITCDFVIGEILEFPKYKPLNIMEISSGNNEFNYNKKQLL